MSVKRKSLEEELSLFGKMAQDKETWVRGLELMQPFVALRDRGSFDPAEVPSWESIGHALRPVQGWHDCSHQVLKTSELAEKDPDDLFDLTDMLRSSPLKEDIPANHLFTATGYAFSELFMDKKEKSLHSALAEIAPVVWRSENGVLVSVWAEMLIYNYGGLWTHVLWHAMKGRRDMVEKLAPLCDVMAKVAVVGKRKTANHWYLVTA